MKKINTIISCLLFLLLLSTSLIAGNKDRQGQSGASQLLINPWARSTGLHGMNSSVVSGVEAMRLNAGGLAFVNKTQILFSQTRYLSGADINVSALGIAQRVGESGVLGLNFMSLNLGQQVVTTEFDPEGTSGATFTPQALNLGIAYAQSFSRSIHVGFLMRIINESIADVSATAVALDMGIQYVTGPDDNIHFGISLLNIGTPMRYRGDGLAIQLATPQSSSYLLTVDQRSEKFELPSTLNIGGAYDILFDKHRITLMGNFTSNSFSRDFLGGGLEYAFNDMFMIRGGYRYEDGINGALDFDERSTFETGLAAGVTLQMPLKNEGSKFAVDYSYRLTNPYGGHHTIGININL